MKVTRTGKWIYGISQGIVFLAVVFFALFIAGAGWLLLEPREVPFLTERVEQTLNRPNQPYILKIGKSILSLGSIEHPLQVTFRDVSLQNLQNQELVSIPAMHVSLGLLSLVAGDVVPGKITLIEPKLSVEQTKKGVFYLAGDAEEKRLALRRLFSSTSKSDSKVDSASLFDSGVEELEIVAGSLLFKSDVTGMTMNIPAADITIRQYGGIFRGRFDMRGLQEGRKDAVIESYFRYEPANQKLLVRLEFKGLNPSDYAELMPELESIEQVKIPIGGKIEVEATLPRTLHKLNVYLAGAEGEVTYPPYFPDKIPISKFLINAQMDGLRKELQLNQFSLQMKRGAVSATGSWSRDAEGKDIVKGTARANEINKEILMRLWPEQLAPVTRQWVKESIIEANVPQADFRIDAPAGSLENVELPDEILKTTIHFKDAKVAYVPGFPVAENGEGVATITGNALNVDVQKATMLENTTLVAPGEVVIPALAADNMEIKLHLPVATDASDVIEFMKATPYKLPTSVNLESSTIAGDLQGDVKVKIIDNISPKPDDVSFDIGADVSGFSQPSFYKGMDVVAANGKIKATDRQLTIDATGELEQQTVKIKTLISKAAEQYHIQTTMPAEELKRYGIDTLPYITGSLGIDLDWTDHAAGYSTVDGRVNLKSALIKIEDIDYLKPPGEEASLILQGESRGGELNLQNFQMLLPKNNEEMAGSASILLNPGELKEVHFTKFNFAGTHGKGTYRPIAGGHYLHAQGSVLDLSFLDDELPVDGATATPVIKAEEPKEWNIPALDLQLAFDEVKMAKEDTRKLHNLKLDALCDEQTCKQLSMNMNAGKAAPFEMNIGHQGDRRILTAYTPRADILLRAMNIFDDMQDGQMRIVGVFQDELPQHPLVGKLTIGPHRVKNIPMLTKLLTVATFTGIVDALSGSGLMFQKLEVPFRKIGMNVYLQDAKTAGPSIGITAEGTLDLARDKVNLRGTVIPAYMFNAIIRSIPILGNVFGVLAGDGLVAMRYSMQGDLDNPDVTVNPLSALTPGFLRSFFSIFESDEIKDTQNPAEVQAALDKLEKDLKNIEQGQKSKANEAPATNPGTVAAPVQPVTATPVPAQNSPAPSAPPAPESPAARPQ